MDLKRTGVLEMPAEAAASTGGTAAGYGGFWIRLLAYLADFAIISLALLLLAVPAAFAGSAGVLVYCALCTVGPVLYFAVMQASPRQATFGKDLLGLRVVHAVTGARISLVRSLGRELAKILSGLILMLGFIVAAFTARKQALHDLMGATVVLREKSARVLAAVVVVVAGIVLPAVALPLMMGAFLGSMMAGVVGGMMGEAMKPSAPVVTVTQSAVKTPTAGEPAPPVAQSAPSAATPVASGQRPPADGQLDFDKLAGGPLTGFEGQGMTRAGPAILEISTLFPGSMWVKVYLPPVKGLELMRGPKVAVDRVADRKGENFYDSSSTFEKGDFFGRASLSRGERPVPHLTGTRSVQLKPGLTESALAEIAGSIRLALPADAQPVAFEAGEAGKDKSVHGATVALRSLQGTDATLHYRGMSTHLLGVRGYDAAGKPVPLQSWQNLPEGRQVDDDFAIKFKAPVAKVEAVVAAGVVEREFPFVLKKDATAGPPSRQKTDEKEASARETAPAQTAVVAVAAPRPETGPLPDAKPTVAVVAKEPASAPRTGGPAPAAATEVAAMPKGEAASAPAPRRAAAPAQPVRRGARQVERPAATAEAMPAKPVRTTKYNDVMTAVMVGDQAAVIELLDVGEWVDARSAAGYTPLMAAAMNGDAKMAELLLKHGADPRLSGPGGMSAADLARRRGDAAMLEALQRASR